MWIQARLGIRIDQERQQIRLEPEKPNKIWNQAANRGVFAVLAVTGLFLLIFFSVKVITDTYKVFDSTKTTKSGSRTFLEPSEHQKSADTLAPLKRDFYQNLNNSSQYLRRDSFSQQ